MRDASAAWRAGALHALGARAHLDNMLRNALDGPQDYLGSGDAAHFWDALHMRDRRAAALVEVDLAFQAGTLQWDSVDNVVHEFPKRGALDEYVEGQDDEGEAVEGKAWSDRNSFSSGSMSEEQVENPGRLRWRRTTCAHRTAGHPGC